MNQWTFFALEMIIKKKKTREKNEIENQTIATEIRVQKQMVCERRRVPQYQ